MHNYTGEAEYDDTYDPDTDGSAEISYDSVVTETAKAILFDIYGDGVEECVWVPRSILEQHNEDECTFTVPAWFATKKEWI